MKNITEPSFHGAPRRAPQAQSVCVVLRAEAKIGADEDVEWLLNDLAIRVRAEEPGCTSYVITRMMGSHEHFAVHARFKDWDTFNAHAETAHLARVLPRLTALLASPVSMEIFLEF